MADPTATNVRLEKPYLRTSARLTVAHLKKYLAKKMKTNLAGDAVAAEAIRIMCHGIALPLEISLDAIVRTHWQPASRDQAASEDLVLTYRLITSAEDAAASAGPSGGGGAAAAEAVEPKVEAPAEPEAAAGQPSGGGVGGGCGGDGGGDVAMSEAGEGESATA